MRLPKKHLTNKQRSNRSEKRCAAIHSGKRQPASGALPVAAFKGDVKSRTYLIDDKTTNAKSFSLNSATFKKLRREAFMNNRIAMMRIEFPDITLCVLEEVELCSR